jgi:hypothetical protein
MRKIKVRYKDPQKTFTGGIVIGSVLGLLTGGLIVHAVLSNWVLFLLNTL